MTTSTTFDPTRIAELPAAGGARAEMRREALPDDAQAVYRAQLKEATARSEKVRLRLRSILQRAFGAIDRAEAQGDARPSFIRDMRDPVAGDRFHLDGTDYEFHPDGGTTVLLGRTLRTGTWIPVGGALKASPALIARIAR